MEEKEGREIERGDRRGEREGARELQGGGRRKWVRRREIDRIRERRTKWEKLSMILFLQE